MKKCHSAKAILSATTHVACLVAALITGTTALAVDSKKATAPQAEVAPNADNTKRNERDNGTNQPSADQQSNNESDLVITQKIRQAVIAKKDFSTYAHNIKIITMNGQVLLKGPVRTLAEKQAIEKSASLVVGMEKVKSEIKVTPE